MIFDVINRYRVWQYAVRLSRAWFKRGDETVSAPGVRNVPIVNAESCEVILTFEPVENPFRVINKMKTCLCQHVHMVLFVPQPFTNKGHLKVLSNFLSSGVSGRERFSETGR